MITMQKRMQLAKGRKGAWHMKNAAHWDRIENKAKEVAVKEQMGFIHQFIYDIGRTIEVVDSLMVYAGGMYHDLKFSAMVKNLADFETYHGYNHFLVAANSA
jgi:hypothetical protein